MDRKLIIQGLNETQIPATAVRPDHYGAVVLMLHGITTDRDEYGGFYRKAAQALAARSIASLRIDFRGHGESAARSQDFTISSQCQDATSAMNWILQNLPSDRICIWGTSFGAPPAIFVAQSMRDVRGLFLLAPVLNYRKTFLEPSTGWAKNSFNQEALRRAEACGELLIDGTFPVGLQLLREMQQIDPVLALSNLRIPVEIVHGESDSMVPYGLTQAAMRSATSVKLIGVPNMDHGHMAYGDDDGASPESERNFNLIIDELAQFTSHLTRPEAENVR